MRCYKCGSMMTIVVDDPLGTTYACLDCGHEEDVEYCTERSGR